MSKNFFSKNCLGFTLVEIIVAIGLFSLVLTISFGIFITGINYQRRTLELIEIQREGSFLMETISRDIRMAQTICDNNEYECNNPSNIMIDQQENNDTDIEFKNRDGLWTTYCLSDENGVCDSTGGDYLGITLKDIDENGVTINTDIYRLSSKNVLIEDVKFYANKFNEGPTQRMIVIVMKLKSTGKFDVSTTIQTSVAMRIYNQS